MRIGHGYDAHRLVSDRKLILGGVTIPYEKGLEAHSDGDAVIHALCDALLGAAALGDIGSHFPENDDQYRNIDSRILLRRVFDVLNKNNHTIENIDITILAQAPGMAPYLAEMKNNLAGDLKLQPENINIKASTTEGMGYIGRKEGIAAHAVILLT